MKTIKVTTVWDKALMGLMALLFFSTIQPVMAQETEGYRLNRGTRLELYVKEMAIDTLVLHNVKVILQIGYLNEFQDNVKIKIMSTNTGKKLYRSTYCVGWCELSTDNSKITINEIRHPIINEIKGKKDSIDRTFTINIKGKNVTRLKASAYVKEGSKFDNDIEKIQSFFGLEKNVGESYYEYDL